MSRNKIAAILLGSLILNCFASPLPAALDPLHLEITNAVQDDFEANLRSFASDSGSSSSGGAVLSTKCHSPWMTSAGKHQTEQGWKISFEPTHLARISGRSSSTWSSMWQDLQKCILFPSLSSSARSSMYKQLKCHALFGLTSSFGGPTWDLESWRADISMWKVTVLAPKHKCNW